MVKRVVIPLFAVVLLAGTVSAYIDPGTGGMIVSGVGGAIWPLIVAFFAAAVGFVYKFFGSIKAGFKSMLGRKK